MNPSIWFIGNREALPRKTYPILNSSLSFNTVLFVLKFDMFSLPVLRANEGI